MIARAHLESGVDKHTFQHANARRRTQMATTFVDIDRGRVLDVVSARSGRGPAVGAVEADLVGRPLDVAAIDVFGGYATAIGDVLPMTTLVIDHVHAIRLASEAVTTSAAGSSTTSAIVAPSMIRPTGSSDRRSIRCPDPNE